VRNLFHRIHRGTLILGERRRRQRYNCHQQGDPAWEQRAEAAVRLLADHQADGGPVLRIADFGAGSERLRGVLERELPGSWKYDAYDLHPQRPSTQRLDLSQGVPAATYDVVFILGVLEYLEQADEIPRALRHCGRLVVLSYVVSDGPSPLSRATRETIGWRSHLSGSGIEDAFGSSGFRLVSSAETDEGLTRLWLWGLEGSA
jgi:hypothetical protein